MPTPPGSPSTPASTPSKSISGHNYFCSSFLSPLINRRDDEFGGSLENRAKVARGMVHGRRVEAVGDQIAVTAKLNMTDGVRGGITVEEALTPPSGWRRTAGWTPSS